MLVVHPKFIPVQQISSKDNRTRSPAKKKLFSNPVRVTYITKRLEKKKDFFRRWISYSPAENIWWTGKKLVDQMHSINVRLKFRPRWTSGLAIQNICWTGAKYGGLCPSHQKFLNPANDQKEIIDRICIGCKKRI